MTLNGERSCALFDDSVGRLGKMWGENGEVRRTWFLGEGEAKFYYKNIVEGFLRIFLFRFERADPFSCVLLRLDENLLDLGIFTRPM